MRRDVFRNLGGVLVLVAGACGGRVQDPVDPEPEAAVVAASASAEADEDPPLPPELPGAPIVEVSGEVAAFPSHWLFDPRGDFIAERGNPWSTYEPQEADDAAQEFTLFEVESGARVGTFSCGELEEDPCRDWILPGQARRPAPDASLHAIPDGADIELHAEDDPGSELLAEIPCPGCKEVVSLAFSPDGTQLAVSRAGQPKVEVWNITSRQKSHTLKLEGKHRYAGDVQLAWNAEGLVALAERKPTSDEQNYMYQPYGGEVPYGYASTLPVLLQWPDLDAPPRVRPISAGDESDNLPENRELTRVRAAVLDPLGRFVWALETDWGSRESIGERLAVYALGEDRSQLSWDGTHLPWGGGMDQWYDVDGQSAGAWVGNRTVAWQRAALRSSDWDARVSFEFRALELGPVPRAWHETVYPIEQAEVESVARITSEAFELAGIDKGRPVIYWRTCFVEQRWNDATDEHVEQPERCVGEAPPQIPGASTLSFSPDAGWLLGRREGELEIAPRRSPGQAAGLGLWDERVRFEWLESGLLLNDGSGRLKVVDPSTGKASLELQDAFYVRAALGAEQSRFVVDVGGKVQVRDAATGERVAEIEPGFAGIGYAAFSPDGAQLAVANGTQVAIASLKTGKVQIRWQDEQIRGLAWRHDGAALLTGRHGPLPEVAWNPKTGAADPTLGLPGGVLEGLTPEDLDPSWRFAVTQDGAVLRLLDGVVLEDLDTDNPSTSNGWHAREVPEGHRYVVHDDPIAYRVLGPADVQRYVVRKSLLRDFVAGYPLPPPTWPEDVPLPRRE